MSSGSVSMAEILLPPEAGALCGFCGELELLRGLGAAISERTSSRVKRRRAALANDVDCLHRIVAERVIELPLSDSLRRAIRQSSGLPAHSHASGGSDLIPARSI